MNVPPPIPDQVTFQASVNEIIKIIITAQEEIFPTNGGDTYERMILDRCGAGALTMLVILSVFLPEYFIF